MTLDEVGKIDEQAFAEMNKEKAIKQAELNAYFVGYETGLDKANKILRKYIRDKESDQQ